MMNVNDHRKGSRVVIRKAARGNFLAKDFPGWGADNYADFLIPCFSVAGMRGTVTSVNSHGSAPYTRYSIKLDNGGHIIDGIPGEHFDWGTDAMDRTENLTRKQCLAELARVGYTGPTSYNVAKLRNIVAAQSR